MATAPEDVMVENDMPVPAETLVTVPVPATAVHESVPEPLVVRTSPLLPAPVGMVIVQEPAAAEGRMVSVPDVLPDRTTEPRTLPACPSVIAPEEIDALALVVGAEPAPPPRTICPEPRAADDAIAVELEKYGTPPDVALAGYEIDAHEGVVLDPDKSGRLAVAVPDRMAPAEAVE